MSKKTSVFSRNPFTFPNALHLHYKALKEAASTPRNHRKYKVYIRSLDSNGWRHEVACTGASPSAVLQDLLKDLYQDREHKLVPLKYPRPFFDTQASALLQLYATVVDLGRPESVQHFGIKFLT